MVHVVAQHPPRMSTISKRIGDLLTVSVDVQNIENVAREAELRILQPNTGILAVGPKRVAMPGKIVRLTAAWRVKIENTVFVSSFGHPDNLMFALVVRQDAQGTWDGLVQIPFALHLRPAR